MSYSELEEFGKLLVEHVRDFAIQQCDMVFAGGKTDKAERWRKVLKSGKPEEIIDSLVPDIVDTTLFHLLMAIDEGQLKLTYKDSKGKAVDLYKDGELGGWYAGEWRQTLTGQRCHDKNPNLP